MVELEIDGRAVECAARHIHPRRGGERRHRYPGALLRQDPLQLRRLPAVQRRGRRPRQPRGRLRHPVADGIVVFTESEAVVEARRTVLDLLLSDHPRTA